LIAPAVFLMLNKWIITADLVQHSIVSKWKWGLNASTLSPVNICTCRSYMYSFWFEANVFCVWIKTLIQGIICGGFSWRDGYGRCVCVCVCVCVCAVFISGLPLRSCPERPSPQVVLCLGMRSDVRNGVCLCSFRYARSSRWAELVAVGVWWREERRRKRKRGKKTDTIISLCMNTEAHKQTLIYIYINT